MSRLTRRHVGLTIAATATLGAMSPLSPAQATDGSTALALSPTSPITIPSATHQVERGESVWVIAAKYNVPMADVLRANNLTMSSIIYPGQRLSIPGSDKPAAAPAPKAPAPKTPAPAAPAPTQARTYTVKSGDTLGRIAATQGVSVSSLTTINKLANPNRIYPGQVLKLDAGSAPATPAPSQPAPATPAAPAAPAAPAPASSATYVVKSGDTLSAIAKRHNTSVASLVSLNNLSNPNVLRVGQKLTVSGTAPTTSPSTNKDLVGNTFLGRTYSDAVVGAANENKAFLNSVQVPSRAEMQSIVRQTAIQMGVDPALALVIAYRESGFNHRSVSPANAIGTMQVIPSSGVWASQLVGRDLNLLDPHDNVVAGVAIIRQNLRAAGNLDLGIAAYYQGLGGVRKYGMYPDTVQYVQRVKQSMATFR